MSELRVMASSDLGKKLYDMADKIAMAKNPHLFMNNYIEFPDLPGCQHYTAPDDILQAGLLAIEDEMTLVMTGSAFFDLVSGLDMEEIEETNLLDFLANGWNDGVDEFNKLFGDSNAGNDFV